MIDATTAKWMRNRSDEIAVESGCRFDEDRGQFVVDWMERYCWLYEGTRKPMEVKDWQYEATMRMFGWVKYSERLGRWIRRFTQGSIYVPKKNAKTPTSAAWGLYLTAGDGEYGNHTFVAAKDGGQARIAMKHALQMVQASPELSRDFEINLTEMKLTHTPTLSDIKPISSNDKKAAKAKQGLNGCVIIDETHVVDRTFISESSLDKAGASRDEPLHIEISTAGRDPSSYGRDRYEYGKRVESGDVVDQGLFFLCYEAPQDLDAVTLDADPVKYGKMANPTWGRIIHEEEFLADYNRSKRSLSDLADFMTMRLNVWQQAASPWLKKSDWDACRVEFSQEDMAGGSCCAGLDLAITRDMSALVLMFHMAGGKYRLLPFFYLPEDAAKMLAMKVPSVREWIRDGHIITTPGATTDYRFIKDKFVELAGQFYIDKLIFDEHFAEQVTQEMSEETGVERFKFSQYLSRFNEPTQNFERLVLDRNIEHNGHPVLSWQMGHVNVMTGRNGYMMPVKPKRDEHKKIDGVVASVMALAGVMAAEPESWMATGGLRG